MLEKIGLEKLRDLQSLSNIMAVEAPSNWDIMDIPEDLKEAWKTYTKARVVLVNLMDKYELNTSRMISGA